jgi:hypothetical protein
MSDRLIDNDLEADPTKEVIEARTRAGEENDSAFITQLTDGNYAFVHEQPNTNGYGMVIAVTREICEDAARRARYNNKPSTIAERMGLTETADVRTR